MKIKILRHPVGRLACLGMPPTPWPMNRAPPNELRRHPPVGGF